MHLQTSTENSLGSCRCGVARSGRFRKAETMETLANQAKIDVCVQAPGASVEYGDMTSRKVLRLYMQNPVIWCILAGKWFAMPSIIRS